MATAKRNALWAPEEERTLLNLAGTAGHAKLSREIERDVESVRSRRVTFSVAAA